MYDKVLFQGQISEMEINGFTRSGPLNPKMIFLEVSLSVCVCVSQKRNSKINYRRNLKFGILHLYHM